MKETISLGRLYETTLDSLEFVQWLPSRANAIMKALAENRFKVDLRAFDEKYLMTGLQKIANRLTAGMVLAAMIVGAALMLPIKTRLTIYDYPAIAIIFFLLAAIGGW
jgi:ubiquinone biosynthesis protein